MTARLSNAVLGALPPAIGRTHYDRSALKPGVVHIGLGAFHRAHQAPVFDALAEAGDLRWGVVGASLRSPAVSNLLVPQDCLYSVAVEEDGRRAVSVVRSILDVIVAKRTPRRLIEAIASPQTHLVTVTVTEKGYKLDRASGLAGESDPDTRADLAKLGSPVTMPEFLVAGLRLRRRKRLPAISIVSCDNLSQNGRKLRAAVLEIARANDDSLADWIANDCAFPNTMVDRIVPAIRKDAIERISAELGVVDHAAVPTEPFSQWVIEDHFAGERPELERAGVQFTNDVAPWEEAKLKLVNGAHSAMAYLGGLAGMRTVDEFISKPSGSAFVSLLLDELQLTLHPKTGPELRDYRAMLIRRFANPALGHQLMQIAMDGSQKLPQRLLPAAAEARSRDRRTDAVALAIAAWIRWQAGRDDRGVEFLVDDPLASMTERLLKSARGASEQVRAIFSVGSVFPTSLAADREFQSSVAKQLERLLGIGAQATLEQFVAEERAASEIEVQA